MFLWIISYFLSLLVCCILSKLYYYWEFLILYKCNFNDEIYKSFLISISFNLSSSYIAFFLYLLTLSITPYFSYSSLNLISSLFFFYFFFLYFSIFLINLNITLLLTLLLYCQATLNRSFSHSYLMIHYHLLNYLPLFLELYLNFIFSNPQSLCISYSYYSSVQYFNMNSF